ncbi:MAG TPA: hypothetical protein DDX92_03565 [Flavobacteriales bacterium]|jgi:hypothetical protein|nr:hypothetical protein [Flavobacteriales bacterium]
MDIIVPELGDADLEQLRLISAQLKKDFQMEQLNWNYVDSEISAEGLVGYLTERIRHLIINSDNKLIRLLYRIDVSEEMLSSYSVSSSETLNETVLCKKILERTFQKVLLREAYKKYSSGAHDDNIIDS